jgi:hypothetical protein
MTYLNAKRSGSTTWADKVEKFLWATPGAYLEESTLLILGRNISGVELPPSLYEGMPFQTTEERGIDISVHVRQALTETVKQRIPEREKENREVKECNKI